MDIYKILSISEKCLILIGLAFMLKAIFNF